ncbi:ORF110 [Anguillid herpesvirus 1]|uniref:Protein ORF110 n=1 Tax=Anguillid herpesvirus 1 TaxID=150286 RepID=A0A1J0RF36_9VIRU|nr:ORF110 [Anguillid herpesvirus 1]QRM17056.1 protein ORF110 [Anguillid herpesvirus 1]UTN00365.1 ORF110 [Anguillid herpesvirus 1]
MAENLGTVSIEFLDELIANLSRVKSLKEAAQLHEQQKDEKAAYLTKLGNRPVYLRNGSVKTTVKAMRGIAIFDAAKAYADANSDPSVRLRLRGLPRQTDERSRKCPESVTFTIGKSTFTMTPVADPFEGLDMSLGEDAIELPSYNLDIFDMRTDDDYMTDMCKSVISARLAEEPITLRHLMKKVVVKTFQRGKADAYPRSRRVPSGSAFERARMAYTFMVFCDMSLTLDRVELVHVVYGFCEAIWGARSVEITLLDELLRNTSFGVPYDLKTPRVPHVEPKVPEYRSDIFQNLKFDPDMTYDSGFTEISRGTLRSAHVAPRKATFATRFHCHNDRVGYVAVVRQPTLTDLNRKECHVYYYKIVPLLGKVLLWHDNLGPCGDVTVKLNRSPDRPSLTVYGPNLTRCYNVNLNCLQWVNPTHWFPPERKDPLYEDTRDYNHNVDVNWVKTYLVPTNGDFWRELYYALLNERFRQQRAQVRREMAEKLTPYDVLDPQVYEATPFEHPNVLECVHCEVYCQSRTVANPTSHVFRNKDPDGAAFFGKGPTDDAETFIRAAGHSVPDTSITQRLTMIPGAKPTPFLEKDHMWVDSSEMGSSGLGIYSLLKQLTAQYRRHVPTSEEEWRPTLEELCKLADLIPVTHHPEDVEDRMDTDCGIGMCPWKKMAIDLIPITVPLPNPKASREAFISRAIKYYQASSPNRTAKKVICYNGDFAAVLTQKGHTGFTRVVLGDPLEPVEWVSQRIFPGSILGPFALTKTYIYWVTIDGLFRVSKRLVGDAECLTPAFHMPFDTIHFEVEDEADSLSGFHQRPPPYLVDFDPVMDDIIPLLDIDHHTEDGTGDSNLKGSGEIGIQNPTEAPTMNQFLASCPELEPIANKLRELNVEESSNGFSLPAQSLQAGSQRSQLDQRTNRGNVVEGRVGQIKYRMIVFDRTGLDMPLIETKRDPRSYLAESDQWLMKKAWPKNDELRQLWLEAGERNFPQFKWTAHGDYSIQVENEVSPLIPSFTYNWSAMARTYQGTKIVKHENGLYFKTRHSTNFSKCSPQTAQALLGPNVKLI